MLDAIREGKLDNVLDHPEAEALATVKELDVQWLNAESVHADRNLTMQLRVTEGGAAAPGARLTFRFARPGAAPFYTQAVADSGGAAEIKIESKKRTCPIRRCWCRPTTKAERPRASSTCARRNS